MGRGENSDKNPIYGKSMGVFWKNIFSILQKHFLITKNGTKWFYESLVNGPFSAKGQMVPTR